MLFKDYDFPLLGYVKIPKFEISKEERDALEISDNISSNDFLAILAKKGFEAKLQSGKIPKDKILEYHDRLDTEIAEICRLYFADYIILVYHVMKFCKQEKILNNYGRGSAAGSLLLYCLECTFIDPLYHNLLFERFISSARTNVKEIGGQTYISSGSLPDVDIDSDCEKKGRINEYIQKCFPNQTAAISTFGTLQGKIILKECLKIIEEATEEQAKVAAAHIEVVFGKVESLQHALKENPEFSKWAIGHEKTVKIASKLSGLIKNRSTHASGILICDSKLDDTIPMELSPDKELVTSYDMNDSQMFGVKLDNLGLKNLTVLDYCLQYTGLKMSDIPVEHPSIYEFLNSSDDYHGIFQAEEGLGKKVMKQLKCQNTKDLSMSVALGRPGCMSFLEEVVNAKSTGQIRELDPRIEYILKPTLGVIIFQEQIMALSRIMAGFTALEANDLRKCVTGDTKFLSQTRGWITINSLIKDGYKDDLFLVMDENGKQQWKHIKEIWDSGGKSTNKVTLKNGLSIRLTRWHQILTDSGWKARNCLKETDYAVTCRKVDYIGEDRISESLAIVIIGLVAEGYFISGQGTFVNHNPEIMTFFCNHYEKVFGFKPNVSNDGRVAYINKESRTKINQYLKYGKSINREIPEVMMGMTLETTKKFLSFYLTCEGGVVKSNNSFSVSSKSNVLIDQIQLLMLRFGVNPSRQIKLNPEYGEFHNLDIQCKSDLQLLLSELSCNFEKRKIDELEQAIKNKKNVKLHNIQDVIPESIFAKFRNQYGFLLNYTSGCYYKNGMSVSKFKSFAEKSKDKRWIDFSNGNQVFSKIDSNELFSNQEKVYDFTVDDDTPFIVANGIVIHNCIGKKLKDKVALWKDKFINESIKNNYKKEFVEEIWNTFNASGDYLFCAAHGAAYGTLSATTAYMKANHTAAFFTSLLRNVKNEQDPTQEIAIINSELSHFGLKFRGPNLLKSSLDFSYTGNEIFFGLSSIKGLASKTLERLQNFKKNFTNKFDILNTAKSEKISVGVLQNLIYAGCLDDFLTETRSKTVLEACLWNILTEKEKIECLKRGPEFQYNLFKLVKSLNEVIKTDKGKPVIKDSRRATIKKDMADYLAIYKNNSKHEDFTVYEMESRLLGFSYSQTLQKVYRDLEPDLEEIETVKSYGAGERVVFVGKVKFAGEGLTKKASMPYFRVVVADQTGEITTFLYENPKFPAISQHKELNGRLAKEDDVVVVRGKRSGDDIVNADNIAVQEVKVFAKASELPDKLEETENNDKNIESAQKL